MLKKAIAEDKTIYFDRTNLTSKGRRKILKMVPEHYRKAAFVFPIPDDKILLERISSRPEKTVPVEVVLGFKSVFEDVQKDEGFAVIVRL